MRMHSALARSRILRLAIALIAGGCTAAGAADFEGRGIFAFQSHSGCPFAALSPAGDCHRVALDDRDTRATLDSTTHTIRFRNTRLYGEKTVVGDVLLQGSGQARDGQRVPLTFHALLSRSGKQWSISNHAHAPVSGTFSDIRIDPYQVVVNEGNGERVLLTPAQIHKAVAQPSLAARLVKAFVQVKDNRADTAGNPDITIALGLDRLSKRVARAQFEAPAGASGARLSPSQALQSGNWRLQLEALSSQIPHEVMQRELFLYGLDTHPALQPVMQKGWGKHVTLQLGAIDGKGYVSYAGQRHPFAGADAAARGILQGSFVGLILGWQQQMRFDAR